MQVELELEKIPCNIEELKNDKKGTDLMWKSWS